MLNKSVIIIIVIAILLIGGGGVALMMSKKSDTTPTPTSTPTSTPSINNVDCTVSDWSNWGQCSQECGGGVQSRTRTILTQQSGSGQPCPSLSEEQACNTQECPVKAQFVVLRKISPDNQPLNIAEIIVKDISGSQLSIPVDNVTMSSVFQPQNFGKDKVRDNNVNTFAHTLNATSTDPNQFIKLDLGNMIAISQIVIENRRDCCKDRINNTVLELIDSFGGVVYSQNLPYVANQNTYVFNV
jgi:hypothetical protein